MLDNDLLLTSDQLLTPRHEPSAGRAAAAPLALVSAPQAVFRVTTLADTVDATDGVLSLREAIEQANAAPGRDRITFDSGLRGATISLDSDLPTITDDLAIVGDRQNRGPGGIILDGAYAGLQGEVYAGASRVLSVEGAMLGLSDLTLTRGVVGLQATNSAVTLDRVAVDDNGGDGGVGIYSANGTLALRDSSVTDTHGGLEGDAGVSFRDSDVLVSKSTIAGNYSFFSRGISGTNGYLRIEDSTIADIRGYGETYGVITRGVDLVVVNSTLAGNGNTLEGSIGGGTISLDVPLYTGAEPAIGSTLLINATITGSVGPALQAGATTPVVLQNSIVDGAVAADFDSNGANVFTDPSLFEGVLLVEAGGDQLARPEDIFAETRRVQMLDPETRELVESGPVAGVLADNGGPTQTVALARSALNPAVGAADADDAPLVDQRGALRDLLPDIGAFELSPQSSPLGSLALGLDPAVIQMVQRLLADRAFSTGTASEGTATDGALRAADLFDGDAIAGPLTAGAGGAAEPAGVAGLVTEPETAPV